MHSDNVLTVLGAAYVVILVAMMHFVTLRDEGGLNVIGVVLNAWLQ